MSRKLTPWFPADVKPVRAGIYFVRQLHNDCKSEIVIFEGYCYWSGSRWGSASGTKAGAEKLKGDRGFQNKPWRGLTKESK
jgi:hypothetical protein